MKIGLDTVSMHNTPNRDLS